MRSIERRMSLLTFAGIVFVTFGTIGCGGSLGVPASGTGGSLSAAGSTGDDGRPALGGAGGVNGPGGAGGANGSGGAGGAPAACTRPHSGEVPSEHRATAAACAASTPPPLPDGGIPSSCTTDADCTGNGRTDFYLTCFHGQCSYDGCLADADCGSTGVCACSSDYYG